MREVIMNDTRGHPGGGVGKTNDRLVILVDSTKILSPREREALAEAGDA